MLPPSLFKAARLCVAGNINRDIKTAPFPGKKSLFADGETSVKAIHETIGGGGANSAFAVATDACNRARCNCRQLHCKSGLARCRYIYRRARELFL